MSYTKGHPVRAVGGRLALDFVNTADWSVDDRVSHEKVLSLADVRVWTRALGLGEAPLPESVEPLWALRGQLRDALLGKTRALMPLELARLESRTGQRPVRAARSQPLIALLVASAALVLADERDRKRLKRCPGEHCGWLFVDETRNGRRKWCRMAGCGNRAKAARHYRRTRAETVE